ncbi:hypothetical protein EVAR_29293_1 [Eumeta japonica]|uniref:Uncharacterized protein n=1 Tax=Eumeta variegata TaxID=151549 RepID=A0A4C1VVB0_EUMVA|nr:hypothetical protein EVAR_29293_1 [Eumeta japonica]
MQSFENFPSADFFNTDTSDFTRGARKTLSIRASEIKFLLPLKAANCMFRKDREVQPPVIDIGMYTGYQQTGVPREKLTRYYTKGILDVSLYDITMTLKQL